MSVTNQSKHSASLASTGAKNAATFFNYPISGLGARQYDQSDYTYDQQLDPVSNATVYYDSPGTLPTWTGQTKHAA